MRNEGKEPSPLKPTFSIAIRMAIVLAFLLGMPLIAIPQVSEYLQELLDVEPREQVANLAPSALESVPAADEGGLPESATTVALLASDHSRPAPNQPNPEDLAAAIEALKAQFVEAGVSYMVLEQIGTDSAKYRFRFDLPVAAGSAYRKQFQVVDDAPDEAMRQAWTELQQWRVAGREPAHLERPKVILR